MVKTIRGKITIGIVLISLSVIIMINLIVWKVFKDNLQIFIINDMDKVKTITLSEMKRQYLIKDESDSLNDKGELRSILNTINAQYDIYVSINNGSDNSKQYVGELLDEKDIDRIIVDSNKKSSLLYIKNQEAKIYATYASPIYIEDVYIGTLIFQKDYLNEYISSINLMIKIVAIQSSLFIVMILGTYIWLKKVTSALNILGMGMSFVSQGDLSNRLEATSNDEITSLIHSFNMMQDKVLEQMEYLELERKRTEELEKSSRDFFNYATHEMKTPITAITGYVQLLQEGDMNEEITERAYNRIIVESERMYKMVQNMLVVAKGKETERHIPERFNVKDLLIKSIHEFELIFGKEKIDIQLEGEELTAFAVKEEIRTILLNLIDNGIKYSQDGKIDIECKSKNDNIYIAIENRCLPIPKEIGGNLFDPFVKYNYGDYEQVSSGLGLFICKELAEKNNGSIGYTIDRDRIYFIVELI